MKKSIVVAVAALVVLSLVLALSGCGSGDTNKAKEYVEEADAFAAKVEDSVSEIPEEFSTAFANVSDPAQFEAAAAEVKKLLYEIKEEADKGIAEFEKVDSLNGVEDYKKYADLWIEILNLAKKTVDKMIAFVDEAVKLVNAGDTAGLSTLQSSFESDITKLTDKITDLEKEAETLKKEKNL